MAWTQITNIGRVVTNEDELVGALTTGGEIRIDTNSPIVLQQTVNITQPCTLVGGNITAPLNKAAFYVTCNDVTFSDMIITGSGQAGLTFASEQKLIYAKGTQAQPLDNITVRGCRLTDSRSDNVWLEWCRNSRVNDNLIRRFLYSGVMIISGYGIVVNDNIVTDCKLATGNVDGYGIAMTDILNTPAARCQYVTVSGNRVSFIDREGIDTHGGFGLTVTGNTVTACARGIAFVVGNSTRTTAPTQCVASGNVVDATGVRTSALEGICLFGISGVNADATITGNNITNHSPNIYTSYQNRGLTYIGSNNIPYVSWTDMPLNSSEFRANASYPPQYMVDGKTVYLRGAVIPASGGISAHTAVGTIPNAAAWPTNLSFVAIEKALSASDQNSGTLTVGTDGKVAMNYGSSTTTYSFSFSGSYQASL